jgi:hypothetical protein
VQTFRYKQSKVGCDEELWAHTSNWESQGI